MENKNINPHLIRTDAKRSVKMKTKSKKSMNASFKNMAVALIIMSAPIAVQAKQWSLQDCISYALANNIQLQKTQLTKASAQEALTGHNDSYRFYFIFPCQHISYQRTYRKRLIFLRLHGLHHSVVTPTFKCGS